MGNVNNINETQLKMRFNVDSPLYRRLRKGEFSYVFELDAPPAGHPLTTAAAKEVLLAKKLARVPWISAIAVTDRLYGEDSHDPVEAAALFGEASGKPVIMNISGKGSSPNRIRDLAARAGSEQAVQSVLAVTGDLSDKHPPRTAFNHSPQNLNGYRDSVETIRQLRKVKFNLPIGAGVNHFKYNLTDQYMQYYKMLRKIAVGAEYIITHAGWDMKKYQELQWFLQMREVEIPAIARLPVLSRKRIQKLANGYLPGVPISKAFSTILQRESEISETQALAAQRRRLALQAAGCRLLGYSGVLITGVRTEMALNSVLEVLSSEYNDITSFADWAEAWQEHHAGIQFAPSPDAYYMFSDLLNPKQAMFSASDSKLVEGFFPEPTRSDLIHYHLTELRNSRWFPAFLRTLVRRGCCRLCDERGDSRLWFHLCPGDCPKRLVFGPCGGSSVTGICEWGHAPCFHHRVAAMASRTKQLYKLEEEF